MSVENRVSKLEKAKKASDPNEIFVYYHGEEGYYLTYGGACYETADELAQAQGWPDERGQEIIISYKDD